MRICLITSNLPPRRCGVGDYTALLGGAFHNAGHEVTVITEEGQHVPPGATKAQVRSVIPGWHSWSMLVLLREVVRLKPDVIWVQWVPFLYGRLGTNFWLPLAMLLLRLMGYTIQTMVHEAWLPPTSLKFRLIGFFQRKALSLLVTASKRVGVSTGEATRMMREVFPWRKTATFWSPVGSNIPIVTIPAAALKRQRAEIGVTDETPVVALFSPFGSGKGHELVGHLWKRVLSEELQSVLLIIGASEDEVRAYLPGLAEARNVHCVGYVPPEEVSVWLQSADLFLAPFLDGITTRRTSALSAMAHGLPTVTTRGPLFDASVFEKSPLIITDCDPEQFAEAGIRLMRDGALRRERGEATRLFFERFFQWSAIAGRLLSGDRESIFSVPTRHRYRKNGRVRTDLRMDPR